MTVSAALPEYDRPPLNEIAIGIQYEPLKGFQSRHIGEFWTGISREFPQTEDQPPLLNVSDKGPRFEILQMPPLRRTFFVSADSNYVIQLQDFRFLLNWRKFNENAVYPRFGNVFGKFLEAWGQFSNFAQRANLGSPRATKFELTYVNQIEQDRPLAEVVERHVRMFDWSSLKAQFLTPPTSVNSVWTFALPNQLGFGQANISQGVKPDGRSVLLFVMTGTGDASSKVSLNEWFTETHEWLAKAFVELTTEQAHREWGKR